MLSHATRAIALFMGSFSLLNILGELRIDGFDANIWWIDLSMIHPTISKLLLTVTAILLITFAIKPKVPTYLKRITNALLIFLLIICSINALTFFKLLTANKISSQFPLPFSLLIAAAILLIICTPTEKNPPRKKRKARIIFFLTFSLCMITFPLAQIFCFGKTDYRRPADAIVVLGARTYADGTMSQALSDRTITGCQLYLDGLANRIIFSGGPGDGNIHETQAMKNKAIEMGIPKTAIIIDPQGLNTQKTVENTTKIFQQTAAKNIIVVSHFYHLPRIKMAYQRHLYNVITVPAKSPYTLTRLPIYILREIPALWLYYLHPLKP
ncbi:MAG: YdcF family protein [Chloroflexi bacterium]|nr:YdcF family protein [Chloroflexota bacterium]